MSKPIRILINGRAGAGKDEIAEYLVNNYGFRKIAFSEGIYDIAYALFDMTTKNRKLLQNIGEALRGVDPDVWVKDAYHRAMDYPRVVISDCRRKNEYLYGVENGFVPIRVQSDLETRIERCRLRDGVEPDISLFENESETGADDFEYINVINNGSIEDLHRKVEVILSQIATLNLSGDTTTGRLWNNK